MHIAIDARMYHIHGGHGRYLRELIVNLEELDTTNRYTIILKPEGAALYIPKNPNFKTIVTGTHWYTLGEQISFLRLLNKLHADLVHFPHWNVPLLYRRPFVVTIHDLILCEYPTSAVSTRNPLIFWVKYAGFQIILRHALTHAEHIITVSETTRDQITDHFPELLTETTPIHLATSVPHVISSESRHSRDESRNLNVEIPRLRPASQDFARDDDLRRHFLYLGTAYPHKNLPFLLHAFHQFGIRYGRTYQLILAGAGSIFYDRLLATDTAKTLLENGDLIYKEAPDDAALEELYTNATTVICPSLMEGFGLPALEAAARGVPVIASRIPAFQEVLGDTAIYFNPHNIESLIAALCHSGARRLDDAIESREDKERDPIAPTTSALHDDNLRDKLLSRAQQFSWRKTAEKTLRIYQLTNCQVLA